MGRSFTAKAGKTLDAISVLIGGKSSNEMPDGGFYELGREQADGAITGTVWKPYPADPTKVTRRGCFKIAAEGTITRFPGLSATLRAEAEVKGRKSYAASYGTWRERGAAMLEELDGMTGDVSWSWFEAIHREWQREARVMFAVMPAATNEALAAALRDMLTLPEVARENS